MIEKENLKRVLVTDCGSTTTKAVLFEKTADGWRQVSRGEAATTVEEPYADVTVGALNAFKEIEQINNIKLLQADKKDEIKFAKEDPFYKISDADNKNGIDLYLSTSSAGGGLQMIVSGLVKNITTESAQRAALGAGAIVLDTISADDTREEAEIIKQIRYLKPDIFLITGGIEGGDEKYVLETAEQLLMASPTPRFGKTLKLPVVYAGNSNATHKVKEILAPIAEIIEASNIRPSIDHEDLAPAREAIHDIFMNHVMSHSPGFDKLLSWSPEPIIPTPSAVGKMIQSSSKETKKQVLCADIGGATTDIFSVFNSAMSNSSVGEPIFNRTVSANMGMSYSMANVLLETGIKNILRWLPFEIEESALRDRLMNKMIRPTTLPQTKQDLWIEQAICREALRLSLKHHKSLAVGISGKQRQRSIAEVFSQTSNREELVNMTTLDLVIGSGGVLSHAPKRLESALMMLDGFELAGITEIAVDSIFMLPHLGVFSEIHPEASKEIFEKDCLIKICVSVAPFSKKPFKDNLQEIATVFFDGKEVCKIKRGEIKIFEEYANKEGVLSIVPLQSSIDVGNGAGEKIERKVSTGLHGILVDGRNRPLEKSFSANKTENKDQQIKCYEALKII